MKTEFIPKFITLLAGAVISIVCIVKDVEVTRALEILLATLILFYIIGWSQIGRASCRERV